MSSSQISRRSVLRSALAAGVLRSARAWGAGAPVSQWLLLGNGTEQGIQRARWNSATGEIGTPELAAATYKPTYLVRDSSRPVLYACNEGSGAQATVSAFGFSTGGVPELQLINMVSSHGDSPCFASVGAGGNALYVANYAGGSLAAYPLARDGGLGEAQAFSCADSKICGPLGPVADRQDAAHLHCATISPDGAYVLACDLGDDAILVFPTRAGAKGVLGTPKRIAARAGSGPRHLAFHPNRRWLYCIHELDCTVDVYAWTASQEPQLRLVPDSKVSIRSPHAPATPASTAAEIAVSRDGRFVYTSTRAADVLTVFRADPASGRLTQIQQLSCGGQIPRFFALDPTEKWLVCAHQGSDSLAVFARDAVSGQLTQRSTQHAANPMCVVWV